MRTRELVTRATKILPAAATAFLALLLSRAESVAEGPTEYEVKAAFLYNFAKFVEWPAATFSRTGGSVVLCVLGPNPFGPTLERIAREQKVQGRPMVIKRAQTAAELGPCHLLYGPQPDDSGQLAEAIRAVSVPGRLVVGEGEQFAAQGGGIGFFLEQRRVRFAINLAATDRAGLKVSSKLLKIAKVIRK